MNESIGALEASLELWEALEYVSVVLVILGCAGEYIAEFTSLLPKEALHRLGKRSTILLILALAAELVCLVRSNGLSGQIIASLTESAVKATESAKGFESQIAASNARVKTAEAAIAEAQRGTEIARSEAEEARSMTESERKERLTLEKEVLSMRLKIRDRRLTAEQQKRFASKLEPFRNIPLGIELYNSDDEVRVLAEDIHSALPLIVDNKIGWLVTGIDTVTTPIGFSGIQVVLTPNANDIEKAFAQVIADALRAEDLQVVGPMGQPNRGARMTGGGRIFPIGQALAQAQRTPNVLIAISKKP